MRSQFVDEGITDSNEVISRSDHAQDSRAKAKLRKAHRSLSLVPPLNYNEVLRIARVGAPGFKAIDSLMPVQTKEYLSTIEDEVQRVHLKAQEQRLTPPERTPMRTPPLQPRPHPSRVTLPSLDDPVITHAEADPNDWVEAGYTDACNVAQNASAAIRQLSGKPALLVLKAERDQLLSLFQQFSGTSQPDECARLLEEVLASSIIFRSVVDGWVAAGGNPAWLLDA